MLDHITAIDRELEGDAARIAEFNTRLPDGHYTVVSGHVTLCVPVRVSVSRQAHPRGYTLREQLVLAVHWALEEKTTEALVTNIVIDKFEGQAPVLQPQRMASVDDTMVFFDFSTEEWEGLPQRIQDRLRIRVVELENHDA